MALLLAFAVTSCQKDLDVVEDSQTGSEIQNRLLEDPFLMEHPEILAQAMDAIENGEPFETEVFTYTPSPEEVSRMMSGEQKTAFAGLAGTEILWGTLGNLKLYRNGYTLYGYNVVDDIIDSSVPADRFYLEVPSSTNPRFVRHYIYDASLNLVGTSYRTINAGCTRFYFTTKASTLLFYQFNDCGW